MGVLERAPSGGTDGRTDPAGVDGYAAAWRELDEAPAAHPTRFPGFGSVPLA
ncbi:hypothetical protein ACWCXK_09870 [Streptomyces sp. NPDC001739]